MCWVQLGKDLPLIALLFSILVLIMIRLMLTKPIDEVKLKQIMNMLEGTSDE